MAYVPPDSGEALLNLVGRYTAPISGELASDFLTVEYTPPVSGSLDADFIGRYPVPISGELDADFNDPNYYFPPDSGELIFSFGGAYVPPDSGEAVFNFIFGTEDIDPFIECPPFVSTPSFNADFSFSIYANPFISISSMALFEEYWVVDQQGTLTIKSGFGFRQNRTLVNGLGTDNHFVIHHPIKDSEVQLVIFNYGLFVEASQVIINEVRGRYEGVTSDTILTLSSKFLRGDEAFASQAVINSMPDTLQGALGILNLISLGTQGIETLKLTLTEQEIAAIHAITNTIEAVDSASGALLLMQSLTSLETAIYVFTTHIFIDGILVDRLIGDNTVELSFSQSNIHNEISISSISSDLFELCDPGKYPGTPRIEVQIGSRVLYFLLETRTGSGSNFTLWGRDQTARDSEPWAEKSTVYLTDPTLASEVAASLPKFSAVDWDLYDWVLPDSFEAEGTPIEILHSIVEEIGGVLRSQDDGSLLARPKYIVRPINMSSHASSIEYFANSVVDFGHSKLTGDHYNCVTIRSHTPDSRLPEIEVESIDGSRLQGDTVFVRIFWIDSSPDIQGTYVSDGTIIEIVGPYPNNTFQNEHTEIVEFTDGIAETTYPIFDFDSTNIEWIGDTATIADWNKYGKSISLVETEAFRLAKITYTMEYKRYELTGHDVEQLLAVFYFAEFPALNILVHTEPIATDEFGNLVDKAGDVIETSNLTDQTSAVLKAESWIDDNKYDRLDHSFKSPYRDEAQDGAIIWIDCSRIGSPGNYNVTDVGITIAGGVVINTLKVVKWLV